MVKVTVYLEGQTAPMTVTGLAREAAVHFRDDLNRALAQFEMLKANRAVTAVDQTTYTFGGAGVREVTIPLSRIISITLDYTDDAAKASPS